MTDADPTYLALLAGVCADPADDTARLVMADWFQENGQGELAEFVRLQIEIERSPSFLAPEFDRLRIFERKLRDRGCERGGFMSNWGAASGLPPGAAVEWSRGFVGSLVCTAEDFLRHADAMLWHPEQTVRCGNCCGAGYITEERFGCPRCGSGKPKFRGDGRGAPRPCPPTAQPITHVTLTTMPDVVTLADVASCHRHDGATAVVLPWRIKESLESVWPGVTFELPDQSGTAGTVTVAGQPVPVGNWSIRRQPRPDAGPVHRLPGTGTFTVSGTVGPEE